MTREILKQALEALETLMLERGSIYETAITALREALAQPEQPEQEPVAWVCYGAPGKRDIDFEEADINGLPIGTNLYTTPPAAQRKPLTDEEIAEVAERMEAIDATDSFWREFARAIESAHNIGAKP